MGELRITVDLPDGKMLQALRVPPPYANYDSGKLKETMKQRLSEEFPQAKAIKVNVVPTNGFFGVDVTSTRFDDVLDAMKKAADTISSIIGEESGQKI
jgi:hypothetical protein